MVVKILFKLFRILTIAKKSPWKTAFSGESPG